MSRPMIGYKETMHKIGDKGFKVFVNEFKGYPKIHIRKVVENEEDPSDVIFTKFRVALEPREFEELKMLIPTITSDLKKIEKQLEGRKRTLDRLEERRVANVLANMDQAIEREKARKNLLPLFKKTKVDAKEKEKIPPNSPELWTDSQLM